MTDICFVDTETTSLRHDRRAWDIGIIARTGGRDVEHYWLIEAGDLDLGNADLMSLKIGRFHERHPQYKLDDEPKLCEDEGDALRAIEAITRGAHLAGAVVSFDADVLGQRMRAHGICPSWHYHLIDVEALAVGYLNGKWTMGREALKPPWKSDSLSADLGIKVSDEDRHTALGDARWARDIYDAVMGAAS